MKRGFEGELQGSHRNPYNWVCKTESGVFVGDMPSICARRDAAMDSGERVLFFGTADGFDLYLIRRALAADMLEKLKG